MVLLKAVRSQQGAFKMDSFEDGAAYFALAGEAAGEATHRVQREIDMQTPPEPEKRATDDSGPSWADAPEGAQWVAQDMDGAWYWHRKKPRCANGIWVSLGLYCDFAKKGEPNPNWGNTLQQRPKP